MRIRTEGIITNSIESGKYNTIDGRCISGALGTWASQLLKYFLSREKTISILVIKLYSDDILIQDYVFNYFFSTMFDLLNEEDWSYRHAISVVQKGLNNGDIRFYKAIKFNMDLKKYRFKEVFQEAFNNFQEKESTSNFQSDDDIPF